MQIETKIMHGQVTCNSHSQYTHNILKGGIIIHLLIKYFVNSGGD